MRYASMTTPLGDMVVAGTEEGLTGVWFAEQKYFPLMEKWKEDASMPLLRQAIDELKAYFAGGLKTFSVSLAPAGTEFQKKVWKGIFAIPYGETQTYGTLADAFSSSPRAVGTATGRNPLTIIVPCHRVVGSDRSLTGYAGGLDKKRALLTLEGFDILNDKILPR